MNTLIGMFVAVLCFIVVLVLLFAVEILVYWDVSNSLSRSVAITAIIVFVTICITGLWHLTP